MSFSYHRPIQFHETDSMAIVHHANYIKFFEETRVQWMREKGLLKTHAPFSDLSLAVLQSSCRHMATCAFGDDLEIKMQVQKRGAIKVRFQYAAYRKKDGKLVATGETVHAPLDGEFKVRRLPELVMKELEKEKWTETWP